MSEAPTSLNQYWTSAMATVAPVLVGILWSFIKEKFSEAKKKLTNVESKISEASMLVTQNKNQMDIFREKVLVELQALKDKQLEVVSLKAKLEEAQITIARSDERMKALSHSLDNFGKVKVR